MKEGLSSFVYWFRGCLDGYDKRASSKKLTILAFTMFTLIMIILTAFRNVIFSDMVWVSVVGGALGAGATSAYQAVKDHEIDSQEKRHGN
jgi:heme O synthase-like polyprenyltransferase